MYQGCTHQGPGGLSPRVRGKPPVRLRLGFVRGSIPACAGEARHFGLVHWGLEVYPRVCGGSATGNPAYPNNAGLSPRVRGKRLAPTEMACPTGSIPACAGEAPRDCLHSYYKPVYPRVCGGSGDRPGASPEAKGLSPRVRGKPPLRGGLRCRARSIPACAGEAITIRGLTSQCRVYPRVCGGSGGHLPRRLPGLGLSPRVRGKRGNTMTETQKQRSIPACAGEA